MHGFVKQHGAILNVPRYFWFREPILRFQVIQNWSFFDYPRGLVQHKKLSKLHKDPPNRNQTICSFPYDYWKDETKRVFSLLSWLFVPRVKKEYFYNFVETFYSFDGRCSACVGLDGLQSQKSFPVGVIVSDHNSRLARFDLLWYCRQQDHPCRYFEVSCPFWPCYLVLNSEYRGFFGNNVFRWCYFFSCSENTQKFQFLNAQTISRVNIKCKCAEKSKCSMLLMLVSSDQNGVCQKKIVLCRATNLATLVALERPKKHYGHSLIIIFLNGSCRFLRYRCTNKPFGGS